MMLVFLTGPACLLSFFLAYLCYRRSYYRHTVVLSLFAISMLLVTIGILGFGYVVWMEMDEEFTTAV